MTFSGTQRNYVPISFFAFPLLTALSLFFLFLVQGFETIPKKGPSLALCKPFSIDGEQGQKNVALLPGPFSKLQPYRLVRGPESEFRDQESLFQAQEPRFKYGHMTKGGGREEGKGNLLFLWSEPFIYGNQKQGRGSKFSKDLPWFLTKRFNLATSQGYAVMWNHELDYGPGLRGRRLCVSTQDLDFVSSDNSAIETLKNRSENLNSTRSHAHDLPRSFSVGLKKSSSNNGVLDSCGSAHVMTCFLIIWSLGALGTHLRDQSPGDGSLKGRSYVGPRGGTISSGEGRQGTIRKSTFWSQILTLVAPLQLTSSYRFVSVHQRQPLRGSAGFSHPPGFPLNDGTGQRREPFRSNSSLRESTGICTYVELGNLTIPHLGGIVLIGSSGTGKTFFTKALAESTGLPLVPWPTFSSSSFEDPQAELDFPKIFHCCDILGPSLICFENFQTLAGHRENRDNQSTIQGVTDFLIHTDGLNSKACHMLLGYSNDFDSLDPAIIRPGRFGTHILLDQWLFQSPFLPIKGVNGKFPNLDVCLTMPFYALPYQNPSPSPTRLRRNQTRLRRGPTLCKGPSLGLLQS